jgi:hypothetical protein
MLPLNGLVLRGAATSTSSCSARLGKDGCRIEMVDPAQVYAETARLTPEKVRPFTVYHISLGAPAVSQEGWTSFGCRRRIAAALLNYSSPKPTPDMAWRALRTTTGMN